MNGIKGKLWFKLAAMFVFVISAVAIAGSLVAVVYMADSDIFIDNGMSLNESVLESSLDNKMSELVYAMLSYQPYDLWTDKEEPDSAGSGEDFDRRVLSSDSIKDFANYLDMAYGKENSNLYIEIFNSESELIYSSTKTKPENCVSRTSNPITVSVYGKTTNVFSQFADMDELEKYLEKLDDKGYVYSSKTTVVPLDGYIDEDETPELCSYILEAEYAETKNENLSFCLYIPYTLTVKDDIYIRSEKISMLAEYKYLILAALFISAAMAIISFILVMCSAGYSSRFEGLHLTLFDKLPLELHFIVALLLGGIVFSFLEEIYRILDINHLLAVALIVAALVALAAAVFIIIMMTIAARCKAGKLFHYTVTFGSLILLVRLIKYVFSNIKYIWRVVLVIGATALFEFFMLILIFSGEGIYALFWLLGKAALLAAAIIYAIGIGRIKDCCKKLSAGDSNAKVTSDGMPPDLKSLASDINSIGNGIQRAVDERTKSERLKAELITNVSHDLKTPLTSIVNYVDILSKQDIQPDTAKEHVEVLVRQSQRMKKLIDDLVEASKASAGAISVNPQRLDMSLLMTQAMTEYEAKLEKAEITPILSLPEVPAFVMVDGRLMWRILDNLIGNICKYAQPGTRFYASVSCSEKSVTVVFRNISKYPLNISGEDLMERFVRGDSSRHTEGSGLGLSIARSLCELQNVGFEITIDGDLFKAILTLARLEDIPAPKEPAAQEPVPPAPAGEYPAQSAQIPPAALNSAMTPPPTQPPQSFQPSQLLQPEASSIVSDNPVQLRNAVQPELISRDVEVHADSDYPAQTNEANSQGVVKGEVPPNAGG